MMKRKKNIVMITKDLSLNGISTIVSSYCDNISKDKFNITILSGSEIADKYIKKYENSSVKLIELPGKIENPKGYYTEIWRYLKHHKTDIVHIHGNSAVCTIELLIAKLCGVKKRIMHSHSTSCNNYKAHKLLKPLLNALCTDRLACGEAAGKWIYNNRKFTVLPNAFEIDKFRFDPKKRAEIRNRLGIKNERIIGHIGTFTVSKNHPFLLKIFEEYSKKDNNSYLLLVGEGDELDLIKKKAESLSCKDRIIFYGTSLNPADLYSAIDIFLLPSFHEGLPLVILEAQINGLPCIVSTNVTKEVSMGGDIEWLPIDDAQKWANQIHFLSDEIRIDFITKHKKEVKKYNITNSVKALEDIYS